MAVALKFNPFSRTEHNHFAEAFGFGRLPRIVFHGAHVALGLPGFLLYRYVGSPWWLCALLTLAISLIGKGVWVHWLGWRHLPTVTRTASYVITDVPDLFSDIFLAQLGVVIFALWSGWPLALAWLAAYYVVQTFNGA